MIIGIIDYGMGNLLSVQNAIEYIGQKVKIISNPAEIKSVDKLILPGVGAFDDCVQNLKSNGFIESLNEEVLINKVPILGICLGMQVMALSSEEGSLGSNGLGWFDAQIVKIQPSDNTFRIPHVGWSTLKTTSNSIFKAIPKENADFYFVHSYYMSCKNQDDVIATFEHGGEFTAAVHKENIYGMQFHPEKSQTYGLQILENFISI